jgi:molybdopterin/thiamine biosynthesis adenylyltransferase
MDDFYNELYSRNTGIFSNSEQEKLRCSSIAIIGVGSVGGLLAERLIRLGIGQLKIIDPGVFEKNNSNREFGSSTLSLGQNKAETIFLQIKDINPHAKIDYSSAGIFTEMDASNFLTNCDLVIDGMDFGLFRQSFWLQKTARQLGIYYLFAYAIGFGAMVVTFNPKGMTLEEYDNLPPNVDMTDSKQVRVPLERVIPIIPSYAPATTHPALQQIYAGARPIPAVSIGTGLAAILAANETMNIILQKREIIAAPRYIYIDLLDQKFLVGK